MAAPQDDDRNPWPQWPEHDDDHEEIALTPEGERPYRDTVVTRSLIPSRDRDASQEPEET
jgi:hypothetical protein